VLGCRAKENNNNNNNNNNSNNNTFGLFSLYLSPQINALSQRFPPLNGLKTVDIDKHKTNSGARGGAVVEALRYKSEGRGIDSRWCHWIFH
jgi:hypothetical protein